jgi:hypothetical protein
MSRAERERASGDDARLRLAPWIVAYVAFRAAWLTAAHAALQGTPERARLLRALARHRDVGSGWLTGAGVAVS